MHAHAHGHDHDHGDERGDHRARLLLAIGIAAVLLVLEVLGGYLANSLLLYTDAAHVATDILALALSALAAAWASRTASARKSFGYHRAEVLAAFVNALFLWAVSLYLAWEAVSRIRAPEPIDGKLVVIVGGVGLAANLVMAWILRTHAHGNLNMRGAFLHVLSDALGSFVAVAAGAGVLLTGATWLDPVGSLLVVGLIAYWTWRLTMDTVHVLLEGIPHGLDPVTLKSDLLAVPGVEDVHDLHVWSLTKGVESMSAHVRVGATAEPARVVGSVREVARDRHGIGHVTVQVEHDENPDCGRCE